MAGDRLAVGGRVELEVRGIVGLLGRVVLGHDGRGRGKTAFRRLWEV